MLGILAHALYQGEPLNYQAINMLDQTKIPESKQIICDGYNKETISTYDEYSDFLEDCYIDEDLEYDEAYFTKNVLVVYHYEGSYKHQPKRFYDHVFSVDDIEIINYGTFAFRYKATDEWYDVMFLIEADRLDIRSNDVIFDKIY